MPHTPFSDSQVSTERIIIVDHNTNPVDGTIRWAPGKSLWLTAMTVVALIAGPLTFTWCAFALFIVTSGITRLFGATPAESPVPATATVPEYVEVEA